MKFRARLRALRERFGITGLPVPILITEYVTPGERHEGNLGPPPEPVSGCVDTHNGERIARNPGETVDEFTNRFVSLASRNGRIPPQVWLFSTEDPPAA